MTGRAVLLLVLLGLLLPAPGPAFDDHAFRYVLLAAAALACLAAALLEGRTATTVLTLPLAVFVVVRGAMLLRAPPDGRALRWWTLLLSLVFVHHAAAAVPRRRLMRHASAWLGGALGVLGAWALLQAVLGRSQAAATFANRNFAGAGLAMLLPYALSLKRPRARIPLLVLGLGGLIATGSRGGAFAAAAALGLWAAWRRPRLRIPVLAGLPALVVAAGLVLGDTNTVKVRFAWYRAAAELGLQRPLLGQGAGGFAREYPPIRPLEEHAISGGRVVHAVHDDYLESWAEGGAAGLAAHLLVLAAAGLALRRRRAPACSLLAFAAASLVDLPLRDPALLALAFFPLSFARRRRRFRRAGWALPLAGLVATGALFPVAFYHWRADRWFARYLVSHRRDRAALDRALEAERRHPGALIERSRPDDLKRLLESRPHDAAARYNLALRGPRADLADALRDILRRHDPHHTLTRARLAELVMENDPEQAASLLDEAVRADPRPYLPHLLRARLHRLGGRLDLAEKHLAEAERRSRATAVARERFELELAKLATGVFDAARLRDALRRLAGGEAERRVARDLDRIRDTLDPAGAPRVEREPGESALDFAKRITQAKAAWRRRQAQTVAPWQREALVLAEQLVAADPTADHYRLLGRVVRAGGDVSRATRLEGVALLLEALAAVDAGDSATARARFELARRAAPDLARDEAVREAVRVFASGTHRSALESLFADAPDWLALLER